MIQMIQRRKRTLFVVVGLAVTAAMLFVVAFPFLWRTWMDLRYDAAMHTVAEVPPARVAGVFGARVYRNNRLSSMLRDRMETAIQLYKAGKVDKLLLSGGNEYVEYNEPGAMMAYAIARGVPARDIQPDYGGRRTYDTCYRAAVIFGVGSAILVTQEFHLPRALFLCESLGIEVVGVTADMRPYHPRSLAWSETREIPASLVALFDVLRRVPPPVLGEPIPIQ